MIAGFCCACRLPWTGEGNNIKTGEDAKAAWQPCPDASIKDTGMAGDGSGDLTWRQ